MNKTNPWEIERIDLNYKIQFYGKVVKVIEYNREISVWIDTKSVKARAFDNPIPGYKTWNTLSLRLWKSLPYNDPKINNFNQSDYFSLLEEKEKSETITKFLLSNDIF